MEPNSSSSSAGTPSNGDPPNLELHKAAYEGDLATVKKCVERGDDVNTRDKHGNSPLGLAIHFIRKDVVQYLLANGADPTLKSKAGWAPIHEALASGSRDVVTDVHCASERDSKASFQKKLTALCKALSQLPDFYMELEWEFHSWVPFLSRFCPSDRYKIWKKGNCLRADSSLVGYDNMAWIRGNLSVIFIGDANGAGSLSIIDHQHELVENASDGLVDLAPREADDEVSELFAQELISTQASADEVRFTPSKTWLGSDKTSRVEDRYNCRIYSVDGLQYRVLHRSLKESVLPAKSSDGKKPSIPHSVGDKLEFPWEKYIAADNRGKPIPLLYKNETINVKEKTFKGSVHMSKDFPLKMVDFLPIVEVLAPTNRGFQKFAEFVRLKLPDDGFPVKLELPVFPTVTGLATFSLFEEKKPDEFAPDTFVVPPKYKRTKIRFKKSKEQQSSSK